MKRVIGIIILSMLLAGCGLISTPVPPSATPAPPTETPIPPTPTEKPAPTLTTSLGTLTVGEARMVAYFDCMLDRSLPPCGQSSQPWEAWLIVYLKPPEGTDISTISPLPFLQQDIHIIDGTGEQFGCIMTGDDGTRLYVGFPINSSLEYTLYWPDNQPLVLENIIPFVKVEVATPKP